MKYSLNTCKGKIMYMYQTSQTMILFVKRLLTYNSQVFFNNDFLKNAKWIL